ncbi:MAG: DNA polymerase III subunit delta' [Planctomycetota bacterium]
MAEAAAESPDQSTAALAVTGHDEPLARLAAAINRGRLASTYLFVGPDGVGKRRVALRLAAALFCPHAGPRSVDPCGRCESCRRVARGAHPDVLRVAKPEGKSGLPIDLFVGPADKRNRVGLCHDLALRPMLADRRVAIIEDADDFTVESANCLLKTLEEPPPRSLIILIGTSVARQLPTIRSRSQVVRFGPLPEADVARLASATDAEIEDAPAAAAEARGSVARALRLADPACRAARDAVRRQLATPRLDAVSLAKTLEAESKAAGTEPRVRRALMHELLDAAIGVYHERLRGLPAGENPDRTLAALDACVEAAESLDRNANQSTLVQWLAERLAAAGR